VNKKKKILNVGIIGCGLIGFKRARALYHGKIIACYDTNTLSAKNFAIQFNCENCQSINSIIKNPLIDVIFVCTYHNFLDKITLNALKNGKHVLVEKPVATSLAKINKILKSYSKLKIKPLVHVGYNHRYHPSIILAKKMILQKKIGDIMYLRARYGHGGRKNYHKQWRMIKNISGGGELIDQGSHLIDLSRFFIGNFKKIYPIVRNFFWKNKKNQVDDNTFLTLSTKNKKIAFLHCSCTEWKNKFSLEIFGTTGKIEISGLGGSYGQEVLIWYKMKKKLGVPSKKTWKFPKKDFSWQTEIKIFFEEIINRKKSSCNLNDAYENMKIIDFCYRNKN
jgi:predicted dehydrogenase